MVILILTYYLYPVNPPVPATEWRCRGDDWDWYYFWMDAGLIDWSEVYYA